MKNVFKVLAAMRSIAIIALVAVIGFGVVSCGGDDDGGGGTDIASFAGTWNASGNRSIVFSGSSFNYKVNNTTTYSGTFSTSGTTITFNATGLGTASGNFTLSAETLVLSNHTWDNSVNGTYTKTGESSSNTLACKYIYTFNEPINGKSSGEYCWELSERLRPGSTEIRPINEVKQEMITICAGKPGGVFYDSCPSGFVLKCFTGDNDFNHTGYFYGNDFNGVSCEEVVEKM